MPDINTDRLVLVVVGAHIRAEVYDRAPAMRLREAIDETVAGRWRDAGQGTDKQGAPQVIVLTDLWRLNDPLLAPLPQVSVGHPEVNALSAFLADKVPPAYVVDGELAVQFDAAAPEAVALCWGIDHAATDRAVDEFMARYLGAFADAVVRELGE